AVLGMRAVIARELQAMVRNDLGIRRQREQLEEVPSSHQSSRTARTGPIPIASFPERIAVKTARPTRIKIKTPNNPYGGCSSMLQLNDWRFTSLTRTRLLAAPA